MAVGVAFGADPLGEVGEGDYVHVGHRRAAFLQDDGELEPGQIGGRKRFLAGGHFDMRFPRDFIEDFRHDAQTGIVLAQGEGLDLGHFDQLGPILVERRQHLDVLRRHGRMPERDHAGVLQFEQDALCRIAGGFGCEETARGKNDEAPVVFAGHGDLLVEWYPGYIRDEIRFLKSRNAPAAIFA